MFREALVALVLMAATLVVASSAPALPAPACDAIATAETSTQNDAGSGSDAPDDAAHAHRIRVDGYYWGYLSLVDHGAADKADWYAFGIPSGTRVFMTNVTTNYTLVYPQSFTLKLYPPDGSPPIETYSKGATIRLEQPKAGTYLIQLGATTLDTPVCMGGSDLGVAEAHDTNVTRNHGLYVGCDPLCFESSI